MCQECGVLSGHEVEVPGEVVRQIVGSETAVLPVVGFQTGEVALQSVGGRRDALVVEVVEHVGQRMHEHAAGALDIAEHPSGLLPGGDLGAVSVLPFGDEFEKAIPPGRGGDPVYAEKELPQLAGGRSLRIDPAPGQPLSLDVDQAALQDRIRPEHAENPDHVWVAVHSEAPGMQTAVHQRLEKSPQLWFGVLGDAVLSAQEPVGLPLHQDDDAVRAVQEGSIEEEIPGGVSLQDRCRRRLGEEIPDQTVQLPWAVPTLEGQLAH